MKAHLILDQVKELANDSGRPLKYNILCFFCIELSLRLPSFNVQGLHMTINSALVLINISIRHSNLNFAQHFVIY